VSRVRCLLVDNNAEFMGAAERLLRSQGLEIVGCASSGEEALELVGTLAPDVALVDISLGEDDGFDLTGELVARAPGTRVILISSYEQDELGDLITRSAAAGFLPKTELGAAAIARLLT
jgi:DNA-binding NarL/FixJ family response regulator